MKKKPFKDMTGMPAKMGNVSGKRLAKSSYDEQMELHKKIEEENQRWEQSKRKLKQQGYA